MKQKYNLREITILNSMHDQRIQSISYEKGCLIFHYSDVNYGEEMETHSCDVIFQEVNEGDMFAEVRKKNGLLIEGKVYYDKEFIKFIEEHQYEIETISFYVGYLNVIIQAQLVDMSGMYCEECIIKVFASEVQYLWSKNRRKVV